jgi:hypothetical protein
MKIEENLTTSQKMAVMNGFKKEVMIKLNRKHERRWHLTKHTKLKPIKKRMERRVQDENGKEISRSVVLLFPS